MWLSSELRSRLRMITMKGTTYWHEVISSGVVISMLTRICRCPSKSQKQNQHEDLAHKEALLTCVPVVDLKPHKVSVLLPIFDEIHRINDFSDPFLPPQISRLFWRSVSCIGVYFNTSYFGRCFTHGANLTCGVSYFPDQQLWGARVLVSLMLVSLTLGIVTLSLGVISADEVPTNLWSLFPPFWVYPSPFFSCPHSLHCLVLCPIKTHFHEKLWLTHYTVIYKACVLSFPGVFEFSPHTQSLKSKEWLL